MPADNTKARLAASERKRLAMDMVLAGYTYEQIAQQLGYGSAKSCYVIIKRELARSLRQPAEEIRQMQVARLDAMLVGIWPAATAGNLLAMDRAIKLEERRSKLLGLDITLDSAKQEESKEQLKQFALPATALAPSFIFPYRDILTHGHTEYVFRGGRGSTKSSFVSEAIIELIVNNPEWHAVALRQVQNTLRDSVYSQLMWAISYLGLSDKFQGTVSPLEITYLPTKQKIYFRGGDDPLKIKSIKPAFGYINILWFEELDQFRGPGSVRSIVQSAIRGGDRAYIFKGYNPPQSRSNWVHKETDVPKPNRLVHDSTYLTVPPEWLGQAFIDEAEYLKEVNPTAYEHEYLGVPNSAGGLVFTNLQLREITDDEVAQFDQVMQGLDFGYYPDPLHWVKMHYDAARLTLYIFDEYRANKMSNKELYDALVNEKGYTSDQLLTADSSEMKSIADLRDYGMLIRPAEKGPESVKYSYKWLQSLKAIVVDPKRAPYVSQEMLDYEYDKDKDGNYISEYPDKNNHGIDGVRYGTNHIWKRRGK